MPRRRQRNATMNHDRRFNFCFICPKKTNSVKAMSTHNYDNHKTSCFDCPTCGTAFTRQTLVDLHCQEVHIDTDHTGRECLVCGTFAGIADHTCRSCHNLLIPLPNQGPEQLH